MTITDRIYPSVRNEPQRLEVGRRSRWRFAAQEETISKIARIATQCDRLNVKHRLSQRDKMHAAIRTMVITLMIMVMIITIMLMIAVIDAVRMTELGLIDRTHLPGSKAHQ